MQYIKWTAESLEGVHDEEKVKQPLQQKGFDASLHSDGVFFQMLCPLLLAQ